VQLDFYLFQDLFSNYATTIQGSAFNKQDGSPSTSGTDKLLTRGDSVWTDKISSGTDVTAGTATRVDLYASVTSDRGALVRFQIVDVTGAQNDVVASSLLELETTSGTPMASLTWTPKANRDYRVKITIPASTEPTPVVTTLDKIIYGADASDNTATIEVWNQTGGASVTTQTISVTATAAGSKVGSISFQAAAATDYRARVLRASGKQAVWVDKVVWNTLTAAAWTIDCLDLGLGSQTAGVFTPKTWAAAHATGVDSRAFAYNTSTDVWDSVATLDSATGTALVTVAMAHSDAFEYAWQSSNEVIRWAADGTDTLTYTTIPAAVGGCIAQDRLWTLSEGSGGTIVYSSPLTAAGADITADTLTRSITINSGAKTPDTSLRQRMCGAPTGARFFVNYGDVTCKVYEVDGSGAALEARELADLGAGIKGTCIAYVGGLTFIGAQFFGDSTASDTDKKPRSVLYAIDQNGVLQLVEFFREDSPDVRPPQFLFPYQTDLYVLQGNYVWRHDLRGGGLYLEYQLPAASAGNQRALSVLFGRVFAAYTTEIFVAGSVGTYRQSSVSDGSSLTSSVYDFGLPSVSKALAKIEVQTDTMPSNTSVAIEYQADQSGTWVPVGTMVSGSKQTFLITGVSFFTLQVRAKLHTADGVSTPVLKGVTVWASSATDEEYHDLVLRVDDQDSYDHIANEQVPGAVKAEVLMGIWRGKEVTTLVDGYGEKEGPGTAYLGTIEDIRIENPIGGDGRAVLTFRHIR
jgi:hypothetical protein